ncbi:Uma2 family endonuclease [Nocardiopsis sp. YSL2]|uniref:Uma2 family endonuclease n=1 Tax=Nocardiopsis sp. YSL2 TaxID=2939492 RepID=UPI0026F47405|nr:Uma2 family endonuclease [Nocardiopsis sp. YSL2]
MSVPTVAERPVSEFGEVRLPMPPQEGFTADDLDRIPDLPPHTELIDGSLVLVSPQRLFHMLFLELLGDELKAHAPSGLRLGREFSVKLAERQRPEPDLMLVKRDAFKKLGQTWFPPDAVELAVEVVSPESEIRDRERKPELYARAGVPFFWRVEQDGDDAVVFEYEKDPASPSGDYGRPTVHRGILKTSAPVKLEFDLTDILQR